MLQDPSTEQQPAIEPELDRRLDDIHREVISQGRRIRKTETSFSIFAVFALLLSLGTLIAVAAKLQSKPTVTVTNPAPVAAAPATTPAALPTSATERLTEMKITGSASTVAAGKVKFNVVNAGAAPHEFVVLKTPTPAGQLKTDAAGKADESGNIGETGDMKPGASKTLALNLAPGHYALVCNLPGHYKAGMYADLTVK